MDSSSSDEDNENIIIIAAAAAAFFLLTNAASNSITRVPCRTSQGAQYVTEVLRGHPTRCYENFRMKCDMFEGLCQELSDKYMLRASQNIQIPEMLAMFLFTMGQGASNKLVQETFQHSDETVKRILLQVLHSVYEMAIDIIKPRENQFYEVPTKIRSRPKLQPFINCIGAIDVIHIQAVIPKNLQMPYINGKGVTTQNVVAACDFDMLYVFVAAGYEGSAPDAQVLQHVLTKVEYNFPHPPPGKYYLVNADFANKNGYLAPYKGERYHLPDWTNGRRASGSRELFNHEHASLWNVIERTFGVTKKRWKILSRMPSYPYKNQVCIVIACMALHNFIRMRSRSNEEFENVGDDPTTSAIDGAGTSSGRMNVKGGGSIAPWVLLGIKLQMNFTV